MLGTFAGALDARKINAKEGRLSCEVRGEVEDEGGVLMIKRVHVSHKLRAQSPDEVRETVERVHGIYAQGCPVYRSLRPAFEITSSVEVVPE
ncbi:MAG: OsmC family protein [Terriglobales bacterium]